MKTKKDLLKELQREELSKDERATIKNLIIYLETNPNENTVKKQLEAIQAKIKVIDSRFDLWKTNNKHKFKPGTNLKSIYNAMNNIPKLNFQRKNLEFILS